MRPASEYRGGAQTQQYGAVGHNMPILLLYYIITLDAAGKDL